MQVRWCLEVKSSKVWESNAVWFLVSFDRKSKWAEVFCWKNMSEVVVVCPLLHNDQYGCIIQNSHASVLFPIFCQPLCISPFFRMRIPSFYLPWPNGFGVMPIAAAVLCDGWLQMLCHALLLVSWQGFCFGNFDSPLVKWPPDAFLQYEIFVMQQLVFQNDRKNSHS